MERHHTFLRLVISLGLIIAPVVPAHAQVLQGDDIAISGNFTVFAEEAPASEAQLEINGNSIAMTADGRFAASLPVAPYYVISVGGERFHVSRQVFGYVELFDSACECLRVPQIEIVARQPGRVEFFFAGDAMAGRRYSEPLWDERRLIDSSDPYHDLMRLLDPIRPYVESADIASVNLETVLADEDPGVFAPKSVVFYAPTALAQALADSGFDYVSLGNNHSFDYLDEGLRTTIAAVEAAGLAWSGAGFDESEALRAAQVAHGDQKFAMLGYVGWAGRVEPNQVAENDKGGAAFGSLENIAASVARERADGALPIVQLHGGREYFDQPTERSVERMHRAIDEGAIIVASHHPHVSQGIERYGDGIIAYSLGNFLFDQYFMLTHASYALRVWVERGEVSRAEAIPLRILAYRPVPAVGSTRSFVIDRLRRLSAERGTVLRLNGGHLLIDLDDTAMAIASPRPASRELVFWGDFENSEVGDALDRTLHVEGGSFDFRFSSSGGTAMVIEPFAENGEITIQPSTFFRNIEGEGFDFSLRAMVQSPLTARLLVQQRPSGQGRLEALETAPFVELGAFHLDPTEGWQNLERSFILPVQEDGERLPFRFQIHLEGELPMGTVRIDDLRLQSLEN